MTETPPDYTQVPFVPEVHNPPAGSPGFVGLSQNQVTSLRGNLIESILQVVVQAILGFFDPTGTAFAQLSDWADDIADIPILGPIVELLASLFGIDIGDPGNPTIEDLWEGIPIFEWLADIISPGGSGQTPADPLTQLGNAFQDLLNQLGQGLAGLLPPPPPTGGYTPVTPPAPPPLGTGTPTQTGDTTGSGGGTVTGIGTTTIDPQVRQLLDKLVGAGAMSANTPVPTSTIATALSPGAAQNIQTDFDFQTYTSLSTNGQWMWDWPGSSGGVYGSEGCVRTLRDTEVTVYWLHGTWELAPGMSQLAGPNPGTVCQQVMHQASNIKVLEGVGQYPTDEVLLDFSRAEFVVIQYEAAVYPMGLSTLNGTAALARAIRSRPGKFILLGHSQGGQVISNVLDELRYGTLQDRYDDLLFGCAIGNMRHQKGTTFDDAPVYSGQGYGCSLPTLKDTPTDIWWEMAFGPGTYPAFDEMNGVTYALGDLIACLTEGGDPNDFFSATPNGFRALINFSMSSMAFNELDFVGGLLKMLLLPQGQQVQAVLGPTEAHNTGAWCIQPFLGSGDHRTCWEIMYDHINNILSEYPQAVGNRRQIGGVRFPVKEDEVVQISGHVEWANLPETEGDQIMVGLACYDINDQFIAFIGGSDAAPDATIVAPVGDSNGWRDISGEFIPPEGTAKGRVVALVEAESMTTGIVTFDKGTFAPTGFIAANLIKGLEDLNLMPGNTRGPGGEAELATWYQNMLDGLEKATTGQDSTGAELAQVLTSIREMAETAKNAWELAQSLATEYQGPYGQIWRDAGTYTFDLGPIQTGDLVDIAECGGGGGAMGGGGVFASQGGRPGSWALATYEYGVNIPDTVTELDVTVGIGGAPGGAGSIFAPATAGGNGGDSKVEATGMTSVIAAGGRGGGQVGNNNPGATGLGPGDVTWPPDSVSQHFGGHDVAPLVGLTSGAQYGAAPGGAGAGVNAFVPAGAGGGASGYVSIKVRRPT